MGIGVRLKLARAAAGLSLRALEARMDGLVTAQAIGKYERNQMMPSSSVLHALASALGVTDEYLLNPAAVELVAVEFRRKALTSARETAEVRARILSEVERYLEIESILRIDAGEPFKKGERPPVRTLDEAEASAGTLRSQWRLGDDAIPNLCEFLEDRGVKVCALPLPENVSGVQATVKRADGATVPVIVVLSLIHI
jgi:transcriptional regulator with XRE-family HTH domain